MLAELGLAEREEHLPQELSGGEMQRVALCRAIIHKPQLILADEPTGNLDTANGEAVLDLLGTLAAQGTGILMATHNPEALKRCHKIVRLRDGTLA